MLTVRRLHLGAGQAMGSPDVTLVSQNEFSMVSEDDTLSQVQPSVMEQDIDGVMLDEEQLNGKLLLSFLL